MATDVSDRIQGKCKVVPMI